MKKLLKGMGILCFWLVAAALISEVAVRTLPLFSGVAPRKTLPHAGLTVLGEGTKQLGYRPHTRFRHVYDVKHARPYLQPTGEIAYKMNAFGFRDAEWTESSPPGWDRVLCVGDSFTFGEGVREDDTFVKLLGRHYQPMQKQILNAGVQGRNFQMISRWIVEESLEYKPQEIWYFFNLNDLLPYAMTVDLFARGMTVEPSPSRLWEVSRHALERFQLRRTFDSEMRDSFNGESFRPLARGLRSMARMLEREGVRLRLFILPLMVDFDAYPYEELHGRVRSLCKRIDLTCYDLLPAFASLSAPEMVVHETDQHPNERAHRILADAAAAQVGNF